MANVLTAPARRPHHRRGASTRTASSAPSAPRTPSAAQADLYYAGQGTDQSIWKDVACNPNYIASVAYFPESYGKTLIPAMIDILDGKEHPDADGLFPPVHDHEIINAGQHPGHLSRRRRPA